MIYYPVISYVHNTLYRSATLCCITLSVLYCTVLYYIVSHNTIHITSISNNTILYAISRHGGMGGGGGEEGDAMIFF